MAAEYLANAVQEVSLNDAVIFTASIPCTRGYIYHEDETGIFILKGITNNCFARYRVTFNGNIAIPEGGTVASIAIALSVNGEQRPTSKAIFSPAAVEEFGNVTSTAIITVPRGCCFSLAVRAVVADPAVESPVSISVQNANIVIDRIA